MNKHVLILLCLLSVVSMSLAANPGQASNQAGLVVQFSDDNIQTFCITFQQDSLTGYEFLQAAGLELVGDFSAQGAAVCKIGGIGCAADNCFCKFPPDYWSYWGYSDGSWIYSQLGAGLRQVHNGDVDGWRWGGGQPPTVNISAAEICAPPTATPTLTPTQIPTATPSETPTLAPSETPLPSETPVPTETAAPSETPNPTETLIPSETPVPTETTPTLGPIVETLLQTSSIEALALAAPSATLASPDAPVAETPISEEPTPEPPAPAESNGSSEKDSGPRATRRARKATAQAAETAAIQAAQSSPTSPAIALALSPTPATSQPARDSSSRMPYLAFGALAAGLLAALGLLVWKRR